MSRVVRGAVENWSRSEQGARKLAPCCGAHNRIETTRGQGIQWGSHRLYLSLFMGWFFEPGSWGEQWSLPLLARLAGAAGARQGAALRLNGGAGNVAPHGWGALLAARLLVQAAPKVSRAVLGAVAIQGGPGSSKARRKLQAHRRQGGVGQRSVVSGWRLQGKLAPGMHPLLPHARLPAWLPGGLTSPLLNPWATYNWTARVTVLPKEGTSPSRLSAWAQASSSPTTTCTARRKEVSGHSSSVGQGQSLISGGAADADAGAGRAGCWQGLTAWMWWAGS